MKKLTLILAVALGTGAASLWAQDARGGDEESWQERRVERREKLEDMRETMQIWRLHKMREALELTEEQANAVMKVEEERGRREQDLGQRFEGTLPKIHAALENNAPDSELRAHLDALLKFRDERRKIEDESEVQMRKILSPRQQVKFIFFQKHFEQRMRQMMVQGKALMRFRDGERENGEPPMPPRPRRPMR